MTNPFALDPDATRADCEVRGRHARVVETVGLGNGFKPKRKKTDLSPLQRRWFTANGYTFARVEHANAWGAVTVDLFGFGDWLACKPGEGILLVQTCAHGDASKRERKARSKPELAVWLAAGGKFRIHGWIQRGGTGSRWELIEREIVLEDGNFRACIVSK